MSRWPITVVVAALVAARPSAAPADDVWRSLATSADAARASQEYDRAMLEGDGAADGAVLAEIVSIRQRLIDRAVASYEAAARARPDYPEPHFRAASVLRAFHADCTDRARHQLGFVCQTPLTVAREARLVEHWGAFERLAPGDPRLAEEVLFERALLRTRRGTPDDLRLARDDYRKLLDLRPASDVGPVLGNLAETYMMLGDLDAAIDTYRQSMRGGADLSQEYGLAVALDRDEQVTEARAIMARHGEHGLARFQAHLRDNDIFFVPDGEQYYYVALAAESLGMVDEALLMWEAFLASGAHPQFAPRARAHLDALRARPPRARPPRQPAPRPSRLTPTRWSP